MRASCVQKANSIIGKDRYGCATAKQKGTCSNKATVRRQDIEYRTFLGIKEGLLHPELVETYKEEWRAEIARAAQDHTAVVEECERELAGIDRKIAGIMRAIEDGLYSPEMKSRMAELQAVRERLNAVPAGQVTALPTIPEPDLLDDYRRRIDRLAAHVAKDRMPLEVSEVLRRFIDHVEVGPAGWKYVKVELHADVAELLLVCEDLDPNAKRPASGEAGRQVSVVAGRGFEPLTFRL